MAAEGHISYVILAQLHYAVEVSVDPESGGLGDMCHVP